MNDFRVVSQHYSMQSGIACLQMVCKYFGREYTLDFLSKLFLQQQKGIPCSASTRLLIPLDYIQYVQKLIFIH